MVRYFILVKVFSELGRRDSQREAGTTQGDAIREIWAAWDSPAYTSVAGGAAYHDNDSSGCYQTVDGSGFHTFGVRASLTVPLPPKTVRPTLRYPWPYISASRPKLECRDTKITGRLTDAGMTVGDAP